MIRDCDICGAEVEEKWMRSYNIGRKTFWLCWDCYQASQREATMSDMYRGAKLRKIWISNNKRNK